MEGEIPIIDRFKTSFAIPSSASCGFDALKARRNHWLVTAAECLIDGEGRGCSIEAGEASSWTCVCRVEVMDYG